MPAPAIATAPRTTTPVRTLDAEQIKLLVEQGEKYIAAGDVVAARTIFQRAAEAGDATAALALAATYDPIVLAKLGVMGMGADVEKARAWYQMAESYGSAEASQRLLVLNKR
jgi:TPR repeat protein